MSLLAPESAMSERQKCPRHTGTYLFLYIEKEGKWNVWMVKVARKWRKNNGCHFTGLLTLFALVKTIVTGGVTEWVGYGSSSCSLPLLYYPFALSRAKSNHVLQSTGRWQRRKQENAEAHCLYFSLLSSPFTCSLESRQVNSNNSDDEQIGLGSPDISVCPSVRVHIWHVDSLALPLSVL